MVKNTRQIDQSQLDAFELVSFSCNTTHNSKWFLWSETVWAADRNIHAASLWRKMKTRTHTRLTLSPRDNLESQQPQHECFQYLENTCRQYGRKGKQKLGSNQDSSHGPSCCEATFTVALFAKNFKFSSFQQLGLKSEPESELSTLSFCIVSLVKRIFNATTLIWIENVSV